MGGYRRGEPRVRPELRRVSLNLMTLCMVGRGPHPSRLSGI